MDSKSRLRLKINISKMETLFIIIEGSCKILYNEDDEVILNTGAIVAMKAHINYGVKA
ncbi:cupin [[Clostridium] sordellii]|uniref:hypothetical protein n=1 Tax=Paraclostridium sordellii TaxID=1505 RepID=UPI0005E6514B|nr:hypothetical protein [Paeniclostridium sordellii]MBS6025308.1 hypothetical protein [Paeniclostridium sordellii]MDU5020119.1 hypothetical protein [Clostridiales bacterium]CEN91421.1 cupin [[Clostridium] sordellii] [Paeniclostridium sordellii]CEP50189.1 cupin [[Clostridium] sordellii] [Paeniclostridium sordellii]